jgi:hypothetical protein
LWWARRRLRAAQAAAPAPSRTPAALAPGATSPVPQ